MKIVIVGCGKIGTTVLSSLVAEGHDIVAIDIAPSALTDITNIHDVMAICGNGADSDVLEEAGVSKADLFIAVTGSDELNMLSCFLARRMGAGHTVARIRNPEYNDRSMDFLRRQLELSMAINPERLAAQEMFNILRVPSALKIETFSGRNLEMVEMRLRDESPLHGLRLSEMREKYKAKVLVCYVQRGDEVYIPDGNFVLCSGDKVGVTARPSEFQKLLRALGILQKQAKDVMVLGGSRIAYYLSEMLLNVGSNVKIIDCAPEICSEFCEALPQAVIIHGDGAQQELLLEEGLRSMDAFVSLTGMDEENILISIFAASQDVPKVIAKVNRDELSAMAEKLGLDCIVSPKKISADVMVSYARALENSKGSNVETLYKLMDGKAEALEFNVREDISFTGIPLRQLKFKKNTLIAGIIRDRKTIIPAGDDMILDGDRVVVITAGHRFQDLSDILR